MANFMSRLSANAPRALGRHSSPKARRPESTRVIATINLKGGVGKTTMTVALAEFLAAEHGYRVLVVDLDPQSNASLVLLGEKPWQAADASGRTVADLFQGALESHDHPEFDIDGAILQGVSSVAAVGTVDLLPSSPRLIDYQERLIQMPAGKFQAANPTDVLRKALAPLLSARTYDYILIDCPPAIGTVTFNGLRISHGYLIPTIPDYLCTFGIPQIQTRVKEFATEAGVAIAEIGIVLNKFRAASVVHHTNDRILRTDASLPEVFQTVIPEANQIAAAAEYVKCATLRQKYGQDHYKAFHKVTSEFLASVDRIAA